MSTTPIEIKIPESNTAAEWNTAIKEGAEKAGVELPQPGAAPAAAAAKKEDEPTIYTATLTVGGKDMEFKGASAEDVLKQYSAAVTAAQLATPAAAAPAKVEEKKPAFTEAEMFDIRLKLQTGDVSGLDTYILGSGLLDRYLESKGLNVDQLKATATSVQSNDLNKEWEQATKDFLAKNKEYPGGAQNTYLMGIMLAELGLREKPSVESFEAAFAKLKERNLVFPVAPKTEAEIAAAAAAAAAEPKPKKEATSSTAVGSHGGNERQAVIDPKTKVELDITKLTPRESADAWNELLRRGLKPEQIIIKQ